MPTAEATQNISYPVRGKISTADLFTVLSKEPQRLQLCVTSTGPPGKSVFLPEKEAIHHYLAENCVPGGTNRNWTSYGDKIADITDQQRNILCDPQTSGGLLVAVSPEEITAFKQYVAQVDHPIFQLGEVTEQESKLVLVQ